MHRILVVEDNAINRELLCDWLEAQDYVVLSAEDLGGARRLLQGEQPDAVLLDVQLGNEDGLSLAAWMRRQPEFSGIPVIAVTAHALVTEQQRFLQSGCNACISKPIDFKLLHRELDKWLAPLQKSPSRV
ncbi:MAG TPA: response regulator [Candidatus Limnocylindria bacterium]|jgi:two-component system cell cycle response regulator/two-component system cell cycle response regulator DivK|nr:response regulator [Candidatus Limnocylindria bacterium]